MERQQLVELTTRFVAAFNRNDLDTVMSFFAEDAVYDEFNGARNEGKEAIRAAFTCRHVRQRPCPKETGEACRMISLVTSNALASC